MCYLPTSNNIIRIVKMRIFHHIIVDEKKYFTSASSKAINNKIDLSIKQVQTLNRFLKNLKSIARNVPT